MNSRDFILDEQRDVVRVMQELVGGLSEKNIIKPKHNNISTTQRGVLRQKPVSTKVSFPQERYCGIVADGGVQIVVEKNNSERGVVWEKVMKQDVSSSLRGMVFFQVEKELYAAVGGGREISLYNVHSNENVRISADIEDAKGSCFGCLSVVGEEGSLDQRLLAAHSRIGVVDVSLASLVGGGSYSITGRDFFHKAYGKEHVKLMVKGMVVYVAEDGLLSEFGMDRTLQVQRAYAENIYALAAGDEEKVYVGTTRGTIYRNSEKFFSVGNSLAAVVKMQYGTYERKKGLFFTTYTRGLYSPVYFTDGAGKSEVVSVGGMRESVVDFCVDEKGRLFSLHNNREKMEGIVKVADLGGENRGSLIAFNGKGSEIKIYGGI